MVSSIFKQIPSYIPRQPQLAHMSNERHMVRSPLAWHGPPAAPPDTLYNFMSANHKNLEHQINPLLPPYVRNSTIFDSMDLSLQSARVTTSPLNKGGVMGMPIAPQLDFGIKAIEQTEHALLQQQQQSLLNQTQLGNNYPIHNLSMNASAPQQQQQQMQVTNMSGNTTPNTNLGLKTHTSPNMQANTGKYLNANGGGNDCENSSNMLPPMCANVATTNITTTTNNGNSKNSANNNNNNSNPSSGGPSPVNYMRSDADLVPRLNEHFAKMNEMRRMSFDGEYPAKCVQKSEELANKMMQPTPPLQQPQHQLLSPKKQSPQQQQKTPPQLSPYHNQGNSGKHNGPNSSPNKSPTAQQQLSLLRPGGGSLDYQQFKQQPQQHFIPPTHQPHNTYQPQQQQQQNSSPPNSQLLNRNNSLLHPSKDELKYNTTRARSHSNSSSSSSSSDDDEDDDSVDSSNSSHSRHSRQKSVEKSNPNQTTVVTAKKEEVVTKPQTPPPPNISQKPTSPSENTRKTTLDVQKEELLKENGLAIKEANENSNESIRNKNCDFSQQMLDSPKTKKQKQALKIRNAELTNSNSSNSSLNIDTKNDVIKATSMPTNDNAVLADDLRKEQQQTDNAYSPRSNSHSSNSSSSSSICSHSSRSSNETKSHKTIETEVNTVENIKKEEQVIKEHKQELEDVKHEKELGKNSLEKSSTFEEVENKLEEMFAGIEDEEPTPTATEQIPIIDAVTAVADLNLALQLANNSPTTQENESKSVISEDIKLPVVSLLPMATKASRKSTPPTPTLINTPASQFFNQPKDADLPATNGAAATEELKPNTDLPAAELPCTSASVTVKVIAEIKDATDKEKKQTGKATKRKGVNKSKTKNATATNNKSTANKNNSKQKQQQKANRRRRNSTDEEDSNSAKEPIIAISAAATDVKYRSPFVLVKRDGSVSVINAPTAEEAGSEKLGGKNKKIPGTKYAHERNRIRGLHSSTLSNKYDADTTDSTWICVFCKRGPHKEGLGDLFGPYLISTDCDEYRTALKLPGAIDVDVLFSAKRRKMDMVQIHPRNLPIVPAMHAKQQTQPSPTTSSGGRGKKKRKSQLSTSETSTSLHDAQQDTLNTSTSSIEILDPANKVDIFLGMSKVSENSYEVWIHEDCAVWAPDVYLVGSRVTGLDTTVWNSTRYNCEICAKAGATVCCLERECKTTAHAPCAKQVGWNLNETHMKVYCRRHVEQKCKQMGMLSNALFFVNALQTINNSFMPNP